MNKLVSLGSNSITKCLISIEFNFPFSCRYFHHFLGEGMEESYRRPRREINELKWTENMHNEAIGTARVAPSVRDLNTVCVYNILLQP